MGLLRSKISLDIEQLVCKMARENDWGYARIQGELKKLDIEMSKSSVANILRRNNLPPSPEREGLSWREFLARHAPVFLCSDMFQKEVWTFRGLTTAYVFFVIHLQTRKVILARATFSPMNQWLKQQTRHVLSCKKECLNHLLIFGLDRLQHVVDCYTSYFNEHRPHQGIANNIPAEYNIPNKQQGGSMLLNVTARNIARKDFLGGLLKSYRRAA